jgi:hypothetical protein
VEQLSFLYDVVMGDYYYFFLKTTPSKTDLLIKEKRPEYLTKKASWKQLRALP